MASLLTAENIGDALRELARRLDAAGVEAEIAVVGSAAILLHDPQRVATRDVDTWIACSDAARALIDRAVADIAHERGWPEDWLNDRVQRNGFIPEDAVRERDFTLVVREGAVGVHAASDELLFAMKLRAGRGRRDFDDLDILASRVSVGTADEAMAIYESRYPEDPLKASSRRWIDQRYAR